MPAGFRLAARKRSAGIEPPGNAEKEKGRGWDGIHLKEWHSHMP